MSLKLLVKLLVSVGLLTVLLFNNGLQKPLALMTHLPWFVLPLGIGVYLASQTISAYRWGFLAKVLGFTLSWAELFQVYLLGMFVSLFLPGSIGGDVTRLLHIAKRCQQPKRNALLTLLAERGVGLVTLLLLLTALAFTPSVACLSPASRLTVCALGASVGVGFIVLKCLPSKWFLPSEVQIEPIAIEAQKGKVALCWLWLQQARVYWQDNGLLLKSMGLSLVVHGCMVLIHWVIAQALGLTCLPWTVLTMVYGITALASVLPIAFNGLGVREGTYVWLLQQAGVSPTVAMAFAMTWLAISTLTSTFGAWVFFKGIRQPRTL
jgi:glycosyltransferase 2 family protein